MATIGVLHPGSMGAAVGGALAGAGHEVLWVSGGRSAATARRAEAVGLTDAGTLGALLERSAVVLSICPPDAAAEVAAEVAGFDGIYVDANAISPHRATEIAQRVGPAYVDGGIVGPPPVRPGTTRLYLSGDPGPAHAVAALFAGTALDARVLEGHGATAASALKMAYAAWTKGTAALLLATQRTAGALGVADALHEEWAISQPQLEARLAAAGESATSKGWRWVGEMREIADTFESAGQPGGFHRAAATVFDGYPRPAG
jgi:3-hydroxyisobutyrate dehydrogenase-like beta-hydroxyacid dehydrogenase